MTISNAAVAVPAGAQSFLSPLPGHGFATVGVIDVANDPADCAGETLDTPASLFAFGVTAGVGW